MNELTESDKRDVRDVFAKHLPNSEFDARESDETVRITLHDIPECFGEILTELTHLSFSFQVQGGFEVPPRVIVERRDYYE